MLAVTHDEVELPKESALVIEWKMKWLELAGYSKRNAMTIASRTDIDYRRACDMRQQSDNEKLLLKILL